jgi:hypothetical protein
MQVIDLTGGSTPQGYVPQQSVPYSSSPVPTIPQTPTNQSPYGQPTGATYVNSANPVAVAPIPGSTVPGSTSFQTAPSIQTASRPNSVILPSTEPFPAAVNSGSEELQWRRPSPGF